MKTQERLAFITEIAKRDPGIGKTGMMKFLYLLQTIYKVPLSYDFEIYTYGPYCQTVMSDIEYAEFSDYLKISPVVYPNGMTGYHIRTEEGSEQLLGKESLLLSKYNQEIDNVISFFGGKNAKELELYSTTVFVALSYADNHWGNSKAEICDAVQKIKPHFPIETIKNAYDDLVCHHFLTGRV